jgi:hypothetical protein
MPRPSAGATINGYNAGRGNLNASTTAGIIIGSVLGGILVLGVIFWFLSLKRL